MKFKLLNTVFIGLVLSASSIVNIANAGLILDITNNGSGGTRWIMSGSTIATASGSADSLWAWGISSMVNKSTESGCEAILSGGGTMTTTTSGARSIVNVCSWKEYMSVYDRLSPSVDRIEYATGDNVSWEADFTTSLLFSTLNIGSYSTRWLQYSDSSQSLRDDIVINIGVQNVPEPSTLVIFALGIMGLVSRRFKKFRS
jgi:hypothetical protein